MRNQWGVASQWLADYKLLSGSIRQRQSKVVNRDGEVERRSPPRRTLH